MINGNKKQFQGFKFGNKLYTTDVLCFIYFERTYKLIMSPCHIELVPKSPIEKE